MNKNKLPLKMVSLFYFNETIAGKDMFLAPMYLGKNLGASLEFVFPINDEFDTHKNIYRGVKLTAIKSQSKFHSTLWSEKEMLWWLIKHAREIDILSLFWLNRRNILFAKIFKILNPNGICYVKGDFNEQQLHVNPKNILKSIIRDWMYSSIDVVSAETISIVDFYRHGGMGKVLVDKIEYMPNSFDNQLCREICLNLKSYEEKDNILITVGRIGHPDKNNEMLLKALDQIDLKGWKVLFVGSVEKDFQVKYDQFLENNPDKIDKVILTGLAKDKNELWEIYNKSKVFVLTSPKEGFPNVFPEALMFGNYIITTDVSSVNDITKNGTLGKIIQVNDVSILRLTLVKVFNGEVDLKTYYPKIIDHSKCFQWENAVNKVARKINDIYDQRHNY